MSSAVNNTSTATNNDQQAVQQQQQGYNFHQQLMLAEKRFKDQKTKPKGKFAHDYKAFTSDQTHKDIDGNVTGYTSSNMTQSSSSYSHDNTGSCTICWL